VDDVRAVTLAAAARSFRAFGIARATMVDIAREAGVTRQTLYNRFPGGKDEIVAEVIVDEARRVNDRARRKLDPDQPAADVIADALVELTLAARRSPYVDVLVGHGGLSVTSAVIDRSPSVAEVMSEYWLPILERLRDRGALREGLDVPGLIQWLTFVHVALVSRPETFGGRREPTRARLRRYVAPLITGSFDT
jgi:AcrR family transcriptional regulator